MTEQTDTEAVAPRRKRRIGLYVLLSLAMLCAVLAVLLIGLRGEVRLPGWVQARIETRLSDGNPLGAVRLGEVVLDFSEDALRPVFRVSDLTVLDASAEQDDVRLALPQMTVRIDRDALLDGAVRPESVTLDGAAMHMSRAEDGSIDIALGGEGPRDLQEVLRTVEAIFDGPYLGRLRRVEATGMSITVDDALTDRVWSVTDGRLTLENEPGTLSASLALSLEQVGGAVTTALLSLDHVKGAPEIRVAIRLTDAPARDIAAQSAALSWLSVLDAPISGSLTTVIAGTGQFTELNGALEIGAGRLEPGGGAAPRRFNRAKAYFRFDDAASKLTFDQISLESPSATVTAEGHAYLKGRKGRTVEALVGQFSFADAVLNPPDLLSEPAVFEEGALDMRMMLDPLRVDIGQMVLMNGDVRFQASGHLAARPEGWEIALDAGVPRLELARLMALWPLTLKPKTREWMTENMRQGWFLDVRAAFRKPAVGPERLGLNFGFDELTTTFVRAMPPIEGGRGYGVMTEERLDLKLYEGHVTPPAGGPLSLAGSTMAIPDITIKGGPGDIDLRVAGSLRAALEILDHDPFKFLTKGGISTQIATGRAEARIALHLPLRDGVTLDDVTWSGTGRVTDARSDTLIRGKLLAAPVLDVRADAGGVTLSGSGRLGAVPVQGGWEQKFGPEHRGRSRVEGRIDLSQTFLDEFGIALPDGALAGTGTADVVIDLVRGERPEFRLLSDLNQLTLRLAALNWSKPPAERGRLEVTGALGQPVRIDAVSIEAPGLTASGSVTLTESGALDVAAFDRVRAGGWFDAPVELRGRGPGEPVRVAVTGGSVDMRRATFGGTGGGAGAGGGPVALRLDRVIVSDGMVLTGVEGGLNTSGRLNGRFSARMNGKSPVTVTLAPTERGTGVRLVSQEAGELLAAAGIFSGARGGDLVLQLAPTGQPKSYQGRVDISEIRVRDAPTLAALLSAVSVIGLLEQLSGSGIVFTSAEANLSLTPRGVTVRRGNAVGPSMGISMEGIYDFARARLDMQGVVTPIYMLNGMLEQTRLFGDLFGRTKGEGVFGFTYKLRGPASNPTVSVNPLSALAPGVFRQLFRRSPPTIPTE
ncbi:hypothetical protein DDZ14_15510 [Maritimibacter sp. 55A14]|uniref:YhdP family protein n=1 Tax=Maritimibacter sp. 55A14 TaxID=2174844 RepID=UPI000D603D55|nr:AsmA-like C-terminal region-containing protein [Maritimibacter sp. 55A14]PWE30449.1 hypothetical protein DDZ14_15510 [Maritimibacter sp. 55A14]